MNSLVESGFALLIDASLKAALVWGAAWVVLAAWRPANSSVRHRVWTAALVAMLALPALIPAAPRVAAPAGLYPQLRDPAVETVAVSIARRPTERIFDRGGRGGEFSIAPAIEATAPIVAIGTENSPTVAADGDLASVDRTSQPAVVEPSERGATDEALPAEAPARVNRFYAAILIVYLVGAAVLTGRLLVGLALARRIVSRARTATAPLAEALLPEGSRLLESAEVCVPVTVGLWRPAVLLPADWRSWSEPLLACVLAHEGAHIRRRDTWVAALATLNCAAYWFHPAAWLVRRRLAELAEQVCDDAVIETTGNRSGYARGLLEIAARMSRGAQLAGPAGVAMARTANVEKRIDAIIDADRPLARRMGVWRAAALFVVAAPLVLWGAGLESAGQSAKPSTESAKPQAAEGVSDAQTATPETSDVEAADPAAAKSPKLDEGYALVGRLVDETGAPVTDARMDLVGQESQQTKTDAGGHYRFSRIKEAGEYRLVIESTKWVGFTRVNVAPKLALKPGEPMERDFTLPRACVVRVQTIDEKGQPVAGVRVLAMPANIDAMDWPNGLISHGSRSNKEGWVELGVPRSPQPYNIGAMSDDYASARIEVIANDPLVLTMRSITLNRGVEVRGTAICADGKPAAGWAIDAVPAWWNFLTSPPDAKIADDGSFVLKHVAAGRYNLSVSIPTSEDGSMHKPLQSDVELPPAGGALALKLDMASPQSMGALAGRVRFVGGALKEYVSITARPEDGGDFAHADVRPGTEVFRITPLPPGRYRVTFSGPGIEEKVVRNVQAPADDFEVELTVVGRPKLRGRVTLAGGEVATRFRVRVEKVRTLRGPNYVPDAQWREIENASGEFDIDVPGPGVYRLAVAADGFAPARSADINTDDYDGAPAKIELSAGATLAGSVVDAEGRPIAGARVIPLAGLAAGRGRRSVDVEVAELGVETDAEGRFVIERLTPGQEWLRASHADYSLKLVPELTLGVGLTLTAGENRVDPIVLTLGGTVRGRVFDDQGRPQAGVEIFFRQGIGEGETVAAKLMGEFGKAVTDAQGRYELAHLPPQLCYVARSDPWSSLGVVRQAIFPADGARQTLDLGGETAVTGRLVVNGQPLAETRIQLSDEPNFGIFKAYAMTDGEGRFKLWGPAAGRRTLYFAQPGRRNEWVAAATVTIVGGAEDLGDLNVRTTTVAVTVDGLSTEQAEGARVTLQTYNARWPFGADAGMPMARKSAGDPFGFEFVLPGDYELICTRPDGVALHQRLTVAAAGEPVAATMVWPLGTASISGPLNEDVCGPGGCNPPNLWSKDGRISTSLFLKTGNRFEVLDLPAGDYYLADHDTRNPPPVLEFSLAFSEKKLLDLAGGSYKPSPMKDGFLDVRCFTAEGVPLPGVEIELTGESGELSPNSSQEGRVVFVGPTGKYRMAASFPGTDRVEREVTLVPVSPEGRPIGEYRAEVRLKGGK